MQSISLLDIAGVLAFWVEELLDSGTEAISLLTADARAALLSVARSKVPIMTLPDVSLHHAMGI